MIVPRPLPQFVMAPFFAWKASHNAHHVRVSARSVPSPSPVSAPVLYVVGTLC